jgi:hypothetical protein
MPSVSRPKPVPWRAFQTTIRDAHLSAEKPAGPGALFPTPAGTIPQDLEVSASQASVSVLSRPASVSEGSCVQEPSGDHRIGVPEHAMARLLAGEVKTWGATHTSRPEPGCHYEGRSESSSS